MSVPAPGVSRLDALPAGAANQVLLECNGSSEWARRMEEARPYRSVAALLDAADRIWHSLSDADRREALAAHPRIGDGAAAGQAASEQAGALSASEETRNSLSRANAEYETRFGHIFVVCASGKTPEEMLALCRRRLHNDPESELRVAAEEQRRITRLRLEALARTE